jgi:hypothetical protein
VQASLAVEAARNLDRNGAAAALLRRVLQECRLARVEHAEREPAGTK